MQFIRELMGTRFAVRVEDDIDPAAVEAIFAWWSDVEERFSTFLPRSQISRIGRGELALEAADQDIRHVLAICAELELASGGLFAIRPGRPGGPGIDPAGYVKGWSVDEAALMLRLAGAENFVIYAGGDVLCSGAPMNEEAWRVGVRDPSAPERIAAAVRLKRGAVASSASYERGSHIWGPSPRAGLLSVSVVGPSLGLADALATALYANGTRSHEWMGAFPDYGMILVMEDRTMRVSESLAEQLDGVEVIAVQSA